MMKPLLDTYWDGIPICQLFTKIEKKWRRKPFKCDRIFFSHVHRKWGCSRMRLKTFFLLRKEVLGFFKKSSSFIRDKQKEKTATWPRDGIATSPFIQHRQWTANHVQWNRKIIFCSVYLMTRWWKRSWRRSAGCIGGASSAPPCWLRVNNDEPPWIFTITVAKPPLLRRRKKRGSEFQRNNNTCSQKRLSSFFFVSRSTTVFECFTFEKTTLVGPKMVYRRKTLRERVSWRSYCCGVLAPTEVPVTQTPLKGGGTERASWPLGGLLAPPLPVRPLPDRQYTQERMNEPSLSQKQGRVFFGNVSRNSINRLCFDEVSGPSHTFVTCQELSLWGHENINTR